MSLKKGRAMASTVTTTTNVVLQPTLNKLMLKLLNFLSPMLSGYSLVTNLDSGHLILAHNSTVLNTGWDRTCHQGNDNAISLKLLCSIYLF